MSVRWSVYASPPEQTKKIDLKFGTHIHNEKTGFSCKSDLEGPKPRKTPTSNGFLNIFSIAVSKFSHVCLGGYDLVLQIVYNSMS